MLTKRIIPYIEIDNGKLAVHNASASDYIADSPVELAKMLADQSADEIAIFDCTPKPTSESRKAFLKIITQCARSLFIPVIAGLETQSISQFAELLRAGADKIVLGKCAVENPGLITQASREFGKQSVVVNVTAKRQSVYGQSAWDIPLENKSGFRGKTAVGWARQAYNLGAGELLISVLIKDRPRLDLQVIRTISHAVDIPVTAACGAESLQEIYEAFAIGGADASFTHTKLNSGKFTLYQIKSYLAKRGLPVRFSKVAQLQGA